MAQSPDNVQLFEPEEEVGDVIRRVFKELGSNVPTRTVTQTIIDRKLLPQWRFARFLFRGLHERVRTELAKETDENLPFAQPTGSKRHDPWKQLDLFTKDEAYGLLGRRSQQLRDDHGQLVRLHSWCLDKFGDAPVIPTLS